MRYLGTHISPQGPGVYPVMKDQTYEECFSYFDGRYWHGTWPTSAEAWQMKGAPITYDVHSWYDMM